MAAIEARIANLPFLPVLWQWRAHFFEVCLYLGFYLAYLLSRGMVFPSPDTALANAERVMALERALGFFWEPGWQAWAIEHAPVLVALLNWAYIITYFPIILATALVLFLVRRRRYYYYRTVIAVNLVFALMVFLLAPVAPPLKMSPYFVDTIQTYGPSYYGSPAMASYYNTNAAMPSLHFSWTVIFGVMYLRMLKGWFKAAGLLYPALTFFAITITANHYILDAVAGAALAALAFLVTELTFYRGTVWSLWGFNPRTPPGRPV